MYLYVVGMMMGGPGQRMYHGGMGSVPGMPPPGYMPSEAMYRAGMAQSMQQARFMSQQQRAYMQQQGFVPPQMMMEGAPPGGSSMMPPGGYPPGVGPQGMMSPPMGMPPNMPPQQHPSMITQPAGPMISSASEPTEKPSPKPAQVYPASSDSHTPLQHQEPSAPKSTSPKNAMQADAMSRGYTFIKEESRFSCVKCHYLTYRHDKILQHVEAHQGKIICPVCGKAFIKVSLTIKSISSLINFTCRCNQYSKYEMKHVCSFPF